MEIKNTPLSSIGLYGLIKRYEKQVVIKLNSTIVGVGDDAGVVATEGGNQLITNTLFLEGINFDLVYTPLVHLGYKVVVSAVSDILAMNGEPRHLSLGLGLSSKATLEMVDELMGGVLLACRKYKIDLIGFKPSTSLTGLTISLSLLGSVEQARLVTRENGKPTDVLLVSGDLGSAFMGLQLLEREKRVLTGSGDIQPDFGQNEYVLSRQLKPEARSNVNEFIASSGVKPTAMIMVKDGLAAALLLLCEASGTGCRIYENKIPLHQATLKIAGEMNFNPLIAALNGGDDYELLFSLPLERYQGIMNDIPENIALIGYLTEPGKGCRMFSGAGDEVDIKAQGWIE